MSSLSAGSDYDLIDRDGHRWTLVGHGLWQLQSIGTRRTRQYVESFYGPVERVTPPGVTT